LPDRYDVQIKSGAARELKSLPRDVAELIARVLLSLEENPRPRGCLKLTGSDAYRLRLGDYRIVYEIFDKPLVVLVIRIAHRRDAYR